MTSVPPMIMKLATPVPLTSILSRKRARRRTNRYASFTLTARDRGFNFGESTGQFEALHLRAQLTGNLGDREQAA